MSSLFSKDIWSETAGLFETKLHVEPPWCGKTSFCSEGLAHDLVLCLEGLCWLVLKMMLRNFRPKLRGVGCCEVDGGGRREESGNWLYMT